MCAFAHLQLKLLDADDKTADLIFAALAPPAAGKRPLSARRMKKAMKLARALLDSDRFPQIPPVSADPTRRGPTPGRPRKSG